MRWGPDAAALLLTPPRLLLSMLLLMMLVNVRDEKAESCGVGSCKQQRQHGYNS
jgi:hypothetical protein